MFPAKMEVDLRVTFPSICPQELKPGHAFCEYHCEVVTKENIPTKLEAFLEHCKKISGKGYYCNSECVGDSVNLGCTDVTELMIDEALDSCTASTKDDAILATAESQGTTQKRILKFNCICIYSTKCEISLKLAFKIIKTSNSSFPLYPSNLMDTVECIYH